MNALNIWHRGKLRVCIRTAVLILTCSPAGLTLGQLTNVVPASADEELVIIVNKANPVDNLTIEELRRYFRLEHERWSNGRKNTVLMLPSGAPERQLVLREIYHFTESEFTQYFIQENFAGHVLSAPKELASAVNVCKFVFNVPGAIGYTRQPGEQHRQGHPCGWLRANRRKISFQKHQPSD